MSKYQSVEWALNLNRRAEDIVATAKINGTFESLRNLKDMIIVACVETLLDRIHEELNELNEEKSRLTKQIEETESK